ncbi:MAG: ABC-type uptake system substrate-binding component [Phormidesmis priestleyi Ana]|uniref:Thiamine pyrimidine synthase n=1 Tax=Phormidesmis priestleyi Ana TaxID=1666911 RepID=A0A0P8BQ06_9CYAN|nr:MAG: ABC-type uptake system substrate-binding component [Phormidesmis priestleyi Ana]
MVWSRRQLLQFLGYGGLGLVANGLLNSPRKVKAQSPQTSLTMQLDWKFNVQFAGLLLAKGAELYADQGLDVTLMPWESGVVVPDKVAADPTVIGCAEQNLILAAQAAGAPIKAVATMFQASPLGLMTLPDAQIATLDDLRGKKVGMHVDGLAVMALVQGVNELASDAIEVVEIPYENKYDLLLSGELAAIQCYAVDEPIGFASQYEIEPSVLKLADYGYEAYAQVIFAHNDLIESSPEQLSNFLQATFNGWSIALSDIPAAAAAVVARYVEPGSKYEDVDYQTQSLSLIADYMLRGIEPAALGTIDRDRWQLMAERFAEYRIIEQAPQLQNSLTAELWS